MLLFLCNKALKIEYQNKAFVIGRLNYCIWEKIYEDRSAKEMVSEDKI